MVLKIFIPPLGGNQWENPKLYFNYTLLISGVKDAKVDKLTGRWGCKLTTKDYTYYCPGCGQEKTPESGVLDRRYSVRALRLPYFMCGECRLIYADKTLVRSVISEWRNDSSEFSGPKNIPYEELCKEMTRILDGIIEYYCRTAGYKRAKFKKVITQAH